MACTAMKNPQNINCNEYHNFHYITVPLFKDNHIKSCYTGTVFGCLKPRTHTHTHTSSASTVLNTLLDVELLFSTWSLRVKQSNIKIYSWLFKGMFTLFIQSCYFVYPSSASFVSVSNSSNLVWTFPLQSLTVNVFPVEYFLSGCVKAVRQPLWDWIRRQATFQQHSQSQELQIDNRLGPESYMWSAAP